MPEFHFSETETDNTIDGNRNQRGDSHMHTGSGVDRPNWDKEVSQATEWSSLPTGT